MKTFTLDATDKSFGRLASEAAVILQEKNDPAYKPHTSPTTVVNIANIAKAKFTGKKKAQKIYYRHTGYIGGIKSETLGSRFDKNPEEAFRKTVRLMLPDNKLRNKMLKNIKFV